MPSPEHRAFVEASMGILMSVIMADGKYSEHEFLWWKQAQNSHPLFADVPPEAFNPMLQHVKARLAAESWKTLVSEWALAVPPQQRLVIFELAAELAVADKELEGKEPELLRQLWHALGLPDDVARAIFMSKIETM